jgi:hypothetical protein
LEETCSGNSAGEVVLRLLIVGTKADVGWVVFEKKELIFEPIVFKSVAFTGLFVDEEAASVAKMVAAAGLSGREDCTLDEGLSGI